VADDSTLVNLISFGLLDLVDLLCLQLFYLDDNVFEEPLDLDTRLLALDGDLTAPLLLHVVDEFLESAVAGLEALNALVCFSLFNLVQAQRVLHV